MKTRSATVHRHGYRVGCLRETDRGYIEFRIDPEYMAMPDRPVLGQWFEDHPRGEQRGGRAGDLPPFFANMIPEGDLGVLLRERLNVGYADDLGLLMAVGNDLPGAVIVVPESEDGADIAGSGPRDVEPGDDKAMRFSLAGVQLKFSMIRKGECFQLPGTDARGDWIAKIALDDYSDLCRNEYVTMTWARRSGFSVPECELRVLSDLVDVPYSAAPDSPVFVIRRYDRDGDQRIHQEDFQQVVGRRPDKKYDDITYEQLVLLAMRIMGDGVFEEMVRRLVFMVASCNADAHLKNWSILYPDAVHPVLTPLYDQVFTGQWPIFSTSLALKMGGTKAFVAIDAARFRELARRTGSDPARTEEIVDQTLESIAARWQAVQELPVLGDEYRSRMREHWKRVPLLVRHAGRIV